MVLLYHGNLCDNIIAGDTYLGVNVIMESRDLFLSYIHISLHTGDVKYRI